MVLFGTPTAYLLGVGEHPLDTRARFVLEGDVKLGRIAVGFQRGQQWAGTVNIANAGEFLAVLAPPAAGQYSVVIANSSGPGDFVAF